MGKIKYLQLSQQLLFEMNMQDGINDNLSLYTAAKSPFEILKLSDGRYFVVSPVKAECRKYKDEFRKLASSKIETANTILNSALPDKDSGITGTWCTYGEYSYGSVDEDLYSATYKEDPSNPVQKLVARNIDGYQTASYGFYDKIKLYIAQGYDFSNVFSILVSVSLNGIDGTVVDICNFMLNKSTYTKFVQFESSPIIFGNVIYDRYIELNVLSLQQVQQAADGDFLKSVLVREDGYVKPIIDVNVSYISETDTESSPIERPAALAASIEDLDAASFTSPLYWNFVLTKTLHGKVSPLIETNIDNLVPKLEVNTEGGYIKYYMTYNGEPLDTNIVGKFNVENGYVLYNRKPKSVYEANDDSETIQSQGAADWTLMHDIEVVAVLGDGSEDSQTYTFVQKFYGRTPEITEFYFKPMFKHLPAGTNVQSITFNYRARLINEFDGMQIIRSYTDTGKNEAMVSESVTNTAAFTGLSTLQMSELHPVKVYNVKKSNIQVLSGGKTGSAVTKTKYVKYFYDVTQVVLDENENVSTVDGIESIIVASAPKNYKFVFKKRNSDTEITFFDLSDGMYKLYVMNPDGSNILIDPTYSSNMNTVLGELEFSLNVSHINALMNISPERRIMHIVAVNSDNSMSTLYSVRYDFEL